MNATRTTPPRPFDVTSVFPRLAPLARPAVRLHPRFGSPTPYQSSVGGPLLWPAGRPWPHCDKWHEGPVSPLLPVAQLYTRDIPLLRPRGPADLLQVLWCPFEHPPEYKPPTTLVWQIAADVTDVLATPPAPSDRQSGYTPMPCVLAPELITEYPNFLELDKELQRQLSDWSVWQAAGVAIDEKYEIAPQEFYSHELAEAPGWKVGGWAPWGLTDPVARFCINCGGAMEPLLTIASRESPDYRKGWIPYEDQADASRIGRVDSRIQPRTPNEDQADAWRSSRIDRNPPRIQVSDDNNLQLYICPTCYTHTDLIQ